jgi:FkbM family methyltransferase
MTGWRDAARRLAPPFVKCLYRNARLASRSVYRSLRRVATCSVRGVEIRIAISSELEQWRAETYATKEPETLEWIQQHLGDGDAFFDVGANVGLYSLFAAKINPRATIYAFEPAYMNYARLCNNIELNALSNIVPCNFPLSDTVGFGLFHLQDTQAGSALHFLGETLNAGAGAHAFRQGALSTTLDALVQGCGLPPPALLKIDVDGIEERILKGAEATLQSGSVRTILVELDPRAEMANGESTTEHLPRLGYVLWARSQWLSEVNGMRTQNFIFGRSGARIP